MNALFKTCMFATILFAASVHLTMLGSHSSLVQKRSCSSMTLVATSEGHRKASGSRRVTSCAGALRPKFSSAASSLVKAGLRGRRRQYSEEPCERCYARRADLGKVSRVEGLPIRRRIRQRRSSCSSHVNLPFTSSRDAVRTMNKCANSVHQHRHLEIDLHESDEVRRVGDEEGGAVEVERLAGLCVVLRVCIGSARSKRARGRRETHATRSGGGEEDSHVSLIDAACPALQAVHARTSAIVPQNATIG